MKRLLVLSALSVFIVLNQARPAAAQFRDLVEHLPEGANTLALFNFEAMMASPLAEQEKWNEGYANMYQSGLILVPPQTSHVVIGAQMDIELMTPHWHATVMGVNYEPSMISLTSKYGGNVDQIDGQEAAVLPNNTYVVQFGKDAVGTMFPADRQQATRWVEHVYDDNSTGSSLGEYLAEAETFADREGGTPIILAIDLEHVLSPKMIRHRLDSAACLKGKQVDLDQVATVLASLRGATLGINITDHVFGGLKIDFDQDISLIKEFAKPLVLEVLGNHGAMINEFNDWQVEASGKEILLRGSLGQSGLTRICSILDAPADLRPMDESASPGDAESKQNLVARTTLQYYKMLEQLLGDLKQQKETTQTTTAGLEGMWYERYATKIEAMPTLNVDPEMVQFGVQLAGALRQAEGAMKGVGVARATGFANMQGAQIYDYQEAQVGGAGVGPLGGVYAGGAYAYRSSYNPWESLRADGQEMAQMDMQAKIKGYGAANQVLETIQVAMATIKQKMTAKYQIQF